VDLGLSGKVAIVTGGSRGIGRAVAERLLREGAAVEVFSLRPESVDAAVEELSPLGRVQGLAGDVAEEADVVRLVRHTLDRFGRLDVMVANAGIADPYKSVLDISVAEWDRMLAVHLRGTFLCGREAGRVMKEAGRGGRIVTLASTNAYECDPHAASYNAAKAGILGLTRSLAVDLAPFGIRVNSVAPGWIHTDMAANDLPPRGTPVRNLGIVGRAGYPEDVAAAVAFLASDVCDFLTGTTLIVDGGQMVVAPNVQW
jgi:NAD(P)-dependent dehydrogenase (short-subunit alcohol dehydrogenase family)